MRDDSIDFVSLNPGGEPGEELLDTGAHERRPRWLLLVAIATIVVAGLIVVQHEHSSAPSAKTSSSVASGSVPQPINPAIAATGGNETAGGFERPIDRGADVLDVVVSGNTWWELKSRSITRSGQDGIERQVQLAAPVSRQDRPELVLDLSTQTLWLVELQRRNSTVFSFDNVTLLPRQVVHVGSAISGAASLDGRLFLAADKRLVEVSKRGRPVVVARSARGGFDTVVADSARGGLLVADYGGPTLVWRATLGSTGGLRLARPVRLPVAKATLAVVNGAIWVGGFSQHGAVLRRLNPRTLRPAAVSPLARELGPGAVIVAGGVLDVWVRDGGNGALHCMGSAAGDPLQSWTIDGPVSSGGGAALVATSSGLIPLALRSCSG